MDNTYDENESIKIISQVDCGNAPKKEFLKQLMTAIAKKDISFITEFTTDTVSLKLVGDMTVQGKDRVVEILTNQFTNNIVQVEIFYIITHGNTGAINGTLTLEDNRRHSFCNVCDFVSGKNTIKEITSYVIEI